MDGPAALGRIIIFIGIVIVIFGAVVLLLSRITGDRGALLPGDIVIRRDHVTIYIPIVTMLVLSLILTLLLWIIAAIRR